MRFRLRTLLAVLALVAVSCAVFFALPLFIEIPLLALLVLVSPSIWICGACFAKRHWRAFFLGGIVAGWLPHVCLMYFGGVYGAEVLGDTDFLLLKDWTREQVLSLRVGIASAFLFPGLASFLGGGCGALVYHWFGEPSELRKPAETPLGNSRLHEPYVLVESRVTPLNGHNLAAASPETRQV